MCLQAEAQHKKVQNNPSFDNDIFYLGFTLGYNNMFYRVTPSDKLLSKTECDSVYGVEAITQPGFTLAMLSELKLSKYLSVRVLPGMNFGQRNLIYKMRNLEEYPDSLVFTSYPMYISTIDVECPILFRLKGQRVNNYRPYLVGGGNIRYDLETRRKNQKNEDYSIKVKPLDLFYEIGAGLDCYLTYFKLSIEMKMSYGIKDILVHEPSVEYNKVIDKLKSKMFLLSFHFE